jgi:hypothetical protein
VVEEILVRLAPEDRNPGQFVPVHIHPTQDEFILVQEGVLDLKLDGVWVQALNGTTRLVAWKHHPHFEMDSEVGSGPYGWVISRRSVDIRAFLEADIVQAYGSGSISNSPPKAADQII